MKTVRGDPKIIKAVQNLKNFIDKIGVLVKKGDVKGIAEELNNIANALKLDEKLIVKYPFLKEFAKTTETGLRFVASLFENGVISLNNSSYLVQLLSKQLETVLHSIKN